MIIEEKIWHEDHFAYHITQKKEVQMHLFSYLMKVLI